MKLFDRFWSEINQTISLVSYSGRRIDHAKHVKNKTQRVQCKYFEQLRPRARLAHAAENQWKTENLALTSGRNQIFFAVESRGQRRFYRNSLSLLANSWTTVTKLDSPAFNLRFKQCGLSR